MNFTLRRIEASDNAELARIIRGSLEELGYALDGTVYTDPNTDRMFDCYQTPRTAYWIAESDGEMLGGSGIGEIVGINENICELQRMFLKKEARGLGIGMALMNQCLEFAKDAGFDQVYIETFPKMPGALKLYERSGFKYVDNRIGETGHFSCNVFMLRQL